MRGTTQNLVPASCILDQLQCRVLVQEAWDSCRVPSLLQVSDCPFGPDSATECTADLESTLPEPLRHLAGAMVSKRSVF